MSLTFQDLANIHPALIIAIETRGTTVGDKKIWLNLVEQIELILSQPKETQEKENE